MRLVPWSPSWPKWAWDAAGAAVFAAVSLLPALSRYGLVLGELSPRPSDPLHIFLVLAQTLPLAARRVRPGTVLAVIAAAFALDQSLGYPPSPAGLGLLVALYSAGAHQRRARRATIATGLAAYAALAVVLTLLGSREHPWEFATFAVVPAAAWGAGEIVRLSSAASRATAERAARDAVADERARLARELHDVVSHHVTGMVVQADAASFLVSGEDTALRTQLAAIAESGRRALTDLRGLLDVLGPQTAATAPVIGTLDELADDARRNGQQVRLEEDGSPGGTDEVHLAVYRIVQEGLTNALKHAPGASTDICVDWDGTRVRMATSPPLRPHSRRIVSGGHGLAGLAERVRLAGGRFTAGPDADGAFVLEASLPAAPREAHDGNSYDD